MQGSATRYPSDLNVILSQVSQARLALEKLESNLHGLASAKPDPALQLGLKLGAFAQRLYRERRLRANFLPADLFAEPGWDILLYLYAAKVEGRPISTSSACIAAAVPQTTALRRLVRLHRQGLIYRHGSPKDVRLSLVELTPQTFEKMTSLLLELQPVQAGISR